MVDWDPKEHMGYISYIKFKSGRWVKVDTVPNWVQNASNPPKENRDPTKWKCRSDFYR